MDSNGKVVGNSLHPNLFIEASALEEENWQYALDIGDIVGVQVSKLRLPRLSLDRLLMCITCESRLVFMLFNGLKKKKKKNISWHLKIK